MSGPAGTATLNGDYMETERVSGKRPPKIKRFNIVTAILLLVIQFGLVLVMAPMDGGLAVPLLLEHCIFVIFPLTVMLGVGLEYKPDLAFVFGLVFSVVSIVALTLYYDRLLVFYGINAS